MGQVYIKSNTKYHRKLIFEKNPTATVKFQLFYRSICPGGGGVRKKKEKQHEELDWLTDGSGCVTSKPFLALFCLVYMEVSME